MAEYLFIAERVIPVVQDESAAAAAGLARALAAAKHQVTILSVGEVDHVSRLPGMARRLRTVTVTVGGVVSELPLFEGRSAYGQIPIYVLATKSVDRGEVCAILGTAAASLVRDGLIKPDVVVGWDDTAAAAMSWVPAAARLFVLPRGATGPSLTEEERQAIGQETAVDSVAAESLLALGAAGAHAIVVPSPSAARQLERHPGLAARASDQPVAPVRFGADEPPYDPANDASLPATFSAETPAGKNECRKALAKRAGLALGARTLLLGVPHLTHDAGGRVVLEALAQVVKHDVAVAVLAAGDRALLDQANVLAIEHPGKVAIVSDPSAGFERQLLAGSDAVLIADEEPTGRPAAIAVRYGALPLALEAGADGDYLVDYDAASGTGSALLFGTLDAFEIESAVRRAISMRANADLWQPMVKSLLGSAPRWAATAAQLEILAATAAEPRTAETLGITATVTAPTAPPAL